MVNKSLNLTRKFVSNTTFGLLDQVLLKAGSTIGFILLVRFLPAASIVAVGIGMGYLVLLPYLDIGLHRILLRDYPKIKQEETVRREHLSAYFVFWAVQTAAMLLLYAIVNLLVIDPVKTAGLSFLFFAMTVDVIGVVFQDLIKGIFYADFKQRVATTIGLLLTVARLVSYCLLVLMPYLDTYAWILIGNSLLGAVIWYVTLAKILDFRLALTRRILGIIKHTLADFGIWDHFNRTSIDTLLTVDVLILALLGYLQDIGNYAIALKFTSMLFLIPWQLTRGLQVYIANCANSIERFEAINTVIKTNAIISLLQLMVVLVGSDWMIHLLYGFSTGADVVRFTIVIAVGATIMNFGLPLCGLLSNSCSLRQVFLTVFLPALIIGISVYIAVTIFWGAMGTAYGNVIVYTIMLGTLILFAKRHCPFPLTLQLVTDREKEVIRGFVRG